MANNNVIQIRESESDSSWDTRARCAAKKAGFRAIRSAQQESYDNKGGYMLIEPSMDLPVAGFRYDLTAEEVIEFCAE